MQIPDTINRLLEKDLPADFTPTGMTKERYLDIMELAISAYDDAHINGMMPETGELIDDIHAFARVTSLLGILIANGRQTARRALFVRMMDFCVKDLHSKTGDMGTDFSVKEIMLAFRAVKNIFPEEQLEAWRTELRKIDPYKNYTQILFHPDDAPLHNINIYNMAGEYLRELEGLTDTEAYFDLHWPMQLNRFDENGMYMDPNCPMLYDITTRCQIEIFMGQGYNGKYREQLDEHLRKASFYTLMTQSTCYEFPYGGRSNQFLFNEVLIASNCEYEANRYQREGNSKLAGMFKRAAHLAITSIERWLNTSPPHHIKNFYPQDSMFGCEHYAYYNKYMATLGCFLYIGFLYADDGIAEFPCPAETGGFVFETSDAFHKLFANNGTYFLEIDTNADCHYDCTGLGRIHKKGVPTELGLSVPIVSHPTYHIPQDNPCNLLLCPGWLDDTGREVYLHDLESPQHTLSEVVCDGDQISFTLVWLCSEMSGCSAVKEHYRVTPTDVSITVSHVGANSGGIRYTVPLFVTNGQEQSHITQTNKGIEVAVNGYAYKVVTDGRIRIDEALFYNRNGAYKAAYVSHDTAQLQIVLSLQKKV